MKRVYLDSCIFVAYFSKLPKEYERKDQIINVLSVFSQLEIELWTSMWAITEMVKILILNNHAKPEEVYEIERDIVNACRIEGLKLNFSEVSPLKGYDFKEFFYHIRQGILRHSSGLGDVMHSIIMKNNDLEYVLTFDEKDDFKKIPGLTVLHPRDIILDVSMQKKAEAVH